MCVLLVASYGLASEAVSAYSAEETEETLIIKGDGVSREVTFTRQELEAMIDGSARFVYSASNNFPTDKVIYREGVSLKYILEKAGIKDTAKQLKFISSDGYFKTFTTKELLEEPQYYFGENNNKSLVLPIIALSDSSKNFASMNPIELSLTMGQGVLGEQNNPWFVKYLNIIEVSTENPEQWQAVEFAKKVGADGVSVIPSHPNLQSVKIYYTLDGTRPSIKSNLYNVSATYYQPHLNKPILITKDTEIRAIAIGPGKTESPVSSTVVSFSDNSFTDLSDYPWARIAIENLAQKDILNGMGAGIFAPEQTLTRAQFAAMMVRAMDDTKYDKLTSKKTDYPGFHDVKSTDWFFEYVKKAAERGWIKGYPDETFRPQRPLSREEMITIIVQAIERDNLSESQANEVISSFTNQTQISAWARSYVAAAENVGILEHGHLVLVSASGLTFDARKEASRAEAAITVHKMLNID